MTGVLEELRSAMADPSMRHAALVHMPVAMASLGVVVALVAALARRRRTARVIAMAWFIALAGAAFVASQSGEDAEGALAASLPASAFERVARHAEMADRIWLLALGVAALFALSLLRDRLIRALSSALALGLALATAGWTGITAHHGGVLVYEYGAGTALSRAIAAPGGSPAARPSVPPELGSPGPSAEAAPAGAAGEGTVAAEHVGGAAGRQSPPPTPDAAASAPEAPVGAAVADPRVAFFNDAVLPLLAAHCQACHNAVRPKAKLDLTSAEGVLAGGRSGRPTLVPGRPEESLLIELVKGTHPDIDAMPPDEELSAEEVAMLERWIREGAVWGSSP